MRADSVLDLGGAQVPMGFGSLEEEHGDRKPCSSRAPTMAAGRGGQGNSVLLFENGSCSYGNDRRAAPAGRKKATLVAAGPLMPTTCADVARCLKRTAAPPLPPLPSRLGEAPRLTPRRGVGMLMRVS